MSLKPFICLALVFYMCFSATERERDHFDTLDGRQSEDMCLRATYKTVFL